MSFLTEKRAKSVIFGVSPGGTREMKRFFNLVLGFPLGFPGFLPKFWDFRVFPGYLSSKREKLLHCAQLIDSVFVIGAQCNGPRFYTSRFPYFP